MIRVPRLPALVAAVAIGVTGAFATVPPAASAKESASSTAASKPEQKAKVRIKAFQFRPDPVEVEAGTKIKWRNRDQIEHTVTADESASVEFDGVLSGKGKSFAVTLRDPGTYEYFCARHPSMQGTIEVR